MECSFVPEIDLLRLFFIIPPFIFYLFLATIFCLSHCLFNLVVDVFPFIGAHIQFFFSLAFSAINCVHIHTAMHCHSSCQSWVDVALSIKHPAKRIQFNDLHHDFNDIGMEKCLKFLIFALEQQLKWNGLSPDKKRIWRLNYYVLKEMLYVVGFSWNCNCSHFSPIIFFSKIIFILRLINSKNRNILSIQISRHFSPLKNYSVWIVFFLYFSDKNKRKKQKNWSTFTKIFQSFEYSLLILKLILRNTHIQNG